MDFNKHPFTIVWETTRACDLACFHFARRMPFPGVIPLNLPPYPLFVLTVGTDHPETRDAPQN